MKTILLACTLLLLTACSTESQSAQPNPSSLPLPIEEQKESLYKSTESGEVHYLREVERTEPVWAGISHSNHFGFINTDYVVEITDEDDLQFIMDELITGSVRQPGIVDMAEPYYGMMLEYADGSTESLHLWLAPGDSVGTIMDTYDTHYIYNFDEEVIDRYLSLLPDKAILTEQVYADWVEGSSFGITHRIEPYVDTDIEARISYSEYIVRGSYSDSHPAEVPESWGDDSMAYFPFEVEDALKGDIEEESLLIGQPDYLVTWIRHPETGDDMGIIQSQDPFIARPDPEKEVIVFISMQDKDGEYWRFSEPTMIEVLEDGSLKSLASPFNPDFNTSDRVESHTLEDDWEVEITLELITENFPLTDPFEDLTLEEINNLIK
ncbi:hypothetical protein GCM10008932_09060 [Alkalibacterium iburiense]|uniref:YhfM-like domain-containing protein n=1 Tax=Alkalibacterium iburiense TaxID=290589 RepID=A0ABN0X9L9_9LACT